MPMTFARIAAFLVFLSTLGACTSTPSAQVVGSAESSTPISTPPPWYAGTHGIAD